MATEKKILEVLNALTKKSQGSTEALMPGSTAHRDNLKKIMASDNVLAIGISEKISKKKKTGKLALTFYVEKKIPLTELRGSEVIPPTVPESMTGGVAVNTDVKVIGKLIPEVFFSRTKFQPGNSIGHVNTGAGTFGAVVKDKNNKQLILSNSHVLAQSGTAKKGDKILYPGPADGGVEPADMVAKLHKFIPFKKGNGFLNTVDCAIAEPTGEHAQAMLAEIRSNGIPKGTIKPKIGMKVVKIGRTTGKTVGEITDVNFYATIDYTGFGLGDITFQKQIWCEKKYTKVGDSGALVIDQASGKAVGLHFAGADGGSAHNPIDLVLSQLDVQLVTTKPVKKKKKKNK